MKSIKAKYYCNPERDADITSASVIDIQLNGLEKISIRLRGDGVMIYTEPYGIKIHPISSNSILVSTTAEVKDER